MRNEKIGLGFSGWLWACTDGSSFLFFSVMGCASDVRIVDIIRLLIGVKCEYDELFYLILENFSPPLNPNDSLPYESIVDSES